MVFIGGPRQVGKTTLSLSLLGPNTKINSLAYLNWDSLVDREQILGQKIPSRQKIVVFDEIHKYARWRGLVKGLFDKNRNEVNFIVTGSARLDHFSKGGDSLQGRYHYYRLHPFSLGEISKHASKSDVDILFKLGGFPEPFLSGSEKDLRRWQMERNRRVLYEDLRDLETVKDVTLVELLLATLPERVGSPLSVEKLRILLDSSHQTIERYIKILEKLYVVYRVPPFDTAKVKAVKKEQNVDQKEIDFVVLKNKEPIFAVECKVGVKQLSPHLAYFKQRLGIPKVYQVHMADDDYGNESSTGRLLPFEVFCHELGLV